VRRCHGSQLISEPLHIPSDAPALSSDRCLAPVSTRAHRSDQVPDVLGTDPRDTGKQSIVSLNAALDLSIFAIKIRSTQGVLR
jgi:hypothetical protein